MAHNSLALQEVSPHFINECHAIYNGELDVSSSGNTLAGKPSKDQHNVTIRFILWAHKAENQKNVLPLLEGCDILALEDCRDTVFKTRKEMDAEVISLDNLYNSATEILSDVSTTSDQKLKLLREHELFEPGIQKILNHCVTHGPRTLKKIDIGPYEAELLVNKLDRTVLAQKSEFAMAIDSPASSWAHLREAALAERRAAVAADVYRETIIMHQLELLGRDNPNKTVAVLLGRSHHTITLRFDRSKWNIERFFVKDETAEPAPLHRRNWVRNSQVSADALRVGLDPVYEIDQLILYEVVSYYGEHNMLETFSNLGAEQNHQLLAQMQIVWEESIAKGQPNAEEKIQIRIKAIRQTLKEFLSDIKR